MDFWHKARSLAEEATKRSQELAKDAARRSQDLAAGAPKLSDIVSEASKRADVIRSEALRRAQNIKHLASAIAPTVAEPPLDNDLETFGVTEELREFVQGITPTTFSDFPLEDDTRLYDVDTVSNVRKDLSEWQEKHASLVLTTVKEISKLRYELCPRVMKERKFWRIYFILVNSHVAPYEKKYMEAVESKSSEQIKDEGAQEEATKAIESKSIQEEPTKVETTSKEEVKEANQKSITSTSSTTEQDLDVFLLGDPGDSDGDGPDDDGDGDFDDDFDKMLEGLDDDKDDL